MTGLVATSTQLALVLLGTCYSAVIFGQNIPENAIRAPYGGGWICAKGYQKIGQRCEKIALPDNATLDCTGNAWTCVRGFSKVGQACLKVAVPANGVLDYTGSNWTCTRGYFKAGSECRKVALPENAKLNYTGNGWVCERGYAKSGDSCAKLVIPENGVLDYTGNNWACTGDYKRIGDKCVALTAAEVQRKRATEEEVRRRVMARQQRLLAGEDCQTEFKTSAEVCVQITRRRLDCNESIVGNYYNDCDVVLNYDVKTNYAGGSSLSVDVQCRVEIEYSGRSLLGSGSDSSRKSDTHMLFAHASTSETFRYNFSFSSFSEVTRARLASSRCEIDSVNLY